MRIDEAIHYLERIKQEYDCSYEEDALNMAIAALSRSENPNKWIPVSERLPEKNMECLVAVGDFNLTQMAMYSDLMGIKNHRIFYQGDFGYDNFEDITQYVNAWMPLPEPYKSSPTVAESEES